MLPDARFNIQIIHSDKSHVEHIINTRQMLQHRGGEPSTNYSKIHA